MKRLIRFIGVIGLIAALAAGFWVSSEYSISEAAPITGDFDVSSFPMSEVDGLSPPKLPDISGFTLEALEKKIPEKIQPGETRVYPLEKSYEYRKLKLQRLIDMYSDMQNTREPVGIEVLSGVYDMPSLVKAIKNPAVLEETEDFFIAHVPILIGYEATLIIRGKDKPLRLASDTGSFISNFGMLYVYDTVVEAWNIAADTKAAFIEDRSFRPHLISWCGGVMHLGGSTFRHLGYFASKAYGITHTSCFDSVYEFYPNLPRPTGWVIDNRFEDIYYGYYSYEADDVVLIRNVYEDNIVYGIDPHDRSRRFIIAYNEAYGTLQKHGIIISREVDHSWIFNNISYDNNGSGFMIDRDSKHNIIAYNEARNNGGDGLTFYESSHNLSYKNILVGNKNSGLRVRNSWDIRSRYDVINDNGKAGVQGYTADLTAGEKVRDLEMDPYTQRVELDISHPELMGNGEADFKFVNLESAKFSNIHLFQSPDKIFSGELRGLNFHLDENFSSLNTGLSVKRQSTAP